MLSLHSKPPPGVRSGYEMLECSFPKRTVHIPYLFQAYQLQPSLIHTALWSPIKRASDVWVDGTVMIHTAWIQAHVSRASQVCQRVNESHSHRRSLRLQNKWGFFQSSGHWPLLREIGGHFIKTQAIELEHNGERHKHFAVGIH